MKDNTNGGQTAETLVSLTAKMKPRVPVDQFAKGLNILMRWAIKGKAKTI